MHSENMKAKYMEEAVGSFFMEGELSKNVAYHVRPTTKN